MAQVLGKRRQIRFVSSGPSRSTRRAYCSRSWYQTAIEAQPTQEFQRKMEKTIAVQEWEFVKTADRDALTQLLSDSLKEATGRREKHAQNQQTIGKIGKGTVTFANNFSSFLQAYSGIVEIMQGADQQFGGVAYSALSLLLIVSRFLDTEAPFTHGHRSA